jgi:predicted nucleic acid-binding protein
LYEFAANQLSLKYEGIPIVTTDAVLLELGNALSRFGKQQAGDIIRYFQQAEEAAIIYLSPELFNRGLKLYEQYQDKSWGLVDCISFIVMRDLNITEVLTFDQHFAQAGFVVLKDSL